MSVMVLMMLWNDCGGEKEDHSYYDVYCDDHHYENEPVMLGGGVVVVVIASMVMVEGRSS